MNAKIINDLRQRVTNIKQEIAEKESAISTLNEEINDIEMEDSINIEINEDDDGGETPWHDLDGVDSADVRNGLMTEIDSLESEILDLQGELENAENDLMDIEEDF